MFAYTVTCTFTESAVAEQWIAWLNEEHLHDVCEAGALDAEIVRLDGGEASPIIAQVRYHFADRQAFERYERDEAPRLREEGLKRFPPERGLRYERTTGEVVGTCRRP